MLHHNRCDRELLRVNIVKGVLLLLVELLLLTTTVMVDLQGIVREDLHQSMISTDNLGRDSDHRRMVTLRSHHRIILHLKEPLNRTAVLLQEEMMIIGMIMPRIMALLQEVTPCHQSKLHPWDTSKHREQWMVLVPALHIMGQSDEICHLDLQPLPDLVLLLKEHMLLRLLLRHSTTT